MSLLRISFASRCANLRTRGVSVRFVAAFVMSFISACRSARFLLAQSTNDHRGMALRVESRNCCHLYGVQMVSYTYSYPSGASSGSVDIIKIIKRVHQCRFQQCGALEISIRLICVERFRRLCVARPSSRYPLQSGSFCRLRIHWRGCDVDHLCHCQISSIFFGNSVDDIASSLYVHARHLFQYHILPL